MRWKDKGLYGRLKKDFNSLPPTTQPFGSTRPPDRRRARQRPRQPWNAARGSKTCTSASSLPSQSDHRGSLAQRPSRGGPCARGCGVCVQSDRVGGRGGACRSWASLVESRSPSRTTTTTTRGQPPCRTSCTNTWSGWTSRPRWRRCTSGCGWVTCPTTCWWPPRCKNRWIASQFSQLQQNFAKIRSSTNSTPPLRSRAWTSPTKH